MVKDKDPPEDPPRDGNEARQKGQRLDADGVPDIPREGEPKAVDIGHMRVGSFTAEAVRRLKARQDKLEKPLPLPWDTVSEKLRGGLWPGLHILVGNTGSGKSQWALQAALHAAQAGVPVMYVGLELDRLQLVCRAVALMDDTRGLHECKWSDLYMGEQHNADDKLRKYTPELDKLPLYLEEGPPYGWDCKPAPGEPGLGLNDLAASIRKAHPEDTDAEGNPIPGSKPFLVVLDFLQLVKSSTADVLRERIGQAAYLGRAVAREYNAAVLLVSSTARENYATLDNQAKDTKAKPLGEGNAARLVGLGKESGEVEFAADTVLALGREAWEGETPPPHGTTIHLAIAKQRAGAPGWVRMKFDGNRFSEGPPPPDPPREQPKKDDPASAYMFDD